MVEDGLEVLQIVIRRSDRGIVTAQTLAIDQDFSRCTPRKPIEMPDRRLAVLAIDRGIVVLRPCRAFMLEIGVKAAVPELCKIEDKIIIFTGILLVTTEPAEG